MIEPLRAIVYGDVNLNILDGSAIWVQSMSEALCGAGVDVRVLLKAPVETGRLVDPMRAMPGVTVIDPFTSGLAENRTPLTPDAAVSIIEGLDGSAPADLVVVRGLRLVTAAAASARLHGRLWTYLTDIAQSPLDMDEQQRERLASIVGASRWMLCQTEELRALIEATVPGVSGRCELWSPIVPAPDVDPLPRPTGPLRLVYTGKFAPLWNTLEMTRLPTLLAEQGVDAEVHMVGDKIHDVPGDPDWSVRMREALQSSPGVVWHGGMPRQEAMALAASGDLGLSWRAPEMDASLELSTKVLEFGVLGIPVLLNRTPMHESLLGADYPLFVANESDIVQACIALSADPSARDELGRRMAASVAPYRMEAAIVRLRALLERTFPPPPQALASHVSAAGRPLRVVVASHDLKFFTRIQEHLAGLPGVELRLDHWEALSVHDVSVSEEMVAWADVVICEWAGPNLVWYSRHKRDGQRLIVRLHRFELEAGWLADVRAEAIDQIVCVSPFYAQLTAKRTGWPVERIVVIPNWVDVAQFDRPKLAGAEFTLGMIGISPHRKRPDLGVDVLARLRRRDRRFRLAIKSKMPWDYWWIWRKPEERLETERLFHRLHTDPLVEGAVTFDGFGGDVASWLRRVGWVLSTSDDESFHLAPAEGMASGAVPALLPWPGAETIYDTRWIHPDPASMADAIHDITASGRWQADRALAREQVLASFPLDAVCDVWARILVEDLSSQTAQGTLARTQPDSSSPGANTAE
jgi:glycosyltransferase involved in cell wall biosynthesis